MNRILQSLGAALIFGFALQADAQPPAACYQAARELLLDQPEILQLCCGMETVAPVQCFKEAKEGTLVSDWEAIDLCQCARSTEPAFCYKRYQEKTDLMGFRITALCRQDRFFPLPPTYRWRN